MLVTLKGSLDISSKSILVDNPIFATEMCDVNFFFISSSDISNNVMAYKSQAFDVIY